MWCEPFSYTPATHLLNIVPSTTLSNNTPHFGLYKSHPSYTNLRVFGCMCFPHIDTNHKLQPRSTPCVFLGYPTLHRGYRCLNLATRKIIISRHVFFDETVFPYEYVSPDTPTRTLDCRLTFGCLALGSPQLPTLTLGSPPDPPSSPEASSTPTSASPLSTEASTSPSPTSSTYSPPLPTPHSPPTHHMTTWARAGIIKPIHRLNLHTTTLSPVPRFYLQAIQVPNWHKAMLEEYRTLVDNGTWKLVP